MRRRGWNSWGCELGLGDWHPNSALNGLGSDDFNTFVANVIQKRPGYVSELMYSYAKSGITYVGKCENLSEDLYKIITALGHDLDKEKLFRRKHDNVSPEPKDPIRWDPALKKTLTRLELPSLLHFGYLSTEEQAELGIMTKIRPASSLTIP